MFDLLKKKISNFIGGLTKGRRKNQQKFKRIIEEKKKVEIESSTPILEIKQTEPIQETQEHVPKNRNSKFPNLF